MTFAAARNEARATRTLGASSTWRRVLDRLTDEIGGIESLLTMVSGKIEYAAGPYAQMSSPVKAAVDTWASKPPGVLNGFGDLRRV